MKSEMFEDDRTIHLTYFRLKNKEFHYYVLPKEPLSGSSMTEVTMEVQEPRVWEYLCSFEHSLPIFMVRAHLSQMEEYIAGLMHYQKCIREFSDRGCSPNGFEKTDFGTIPKVSYSISTPSPKHIEDVLYTFLKS